MSSEDNNSTANNNRHPIPTDTDNNPVSFHDNPAHIEGALEEFRLWCDRTGHFLPFYENRAVSLPNGKIAVESLQCVPFILEQVDGDGAPLGDGGPWSNSFASDTAPSDGRGAVDFHPSLVLSGACL